MSTEFETRVRSAFEELAVNKAEARRLVLPGVPDHVRDFMLGHARTRNPDVTVEEVGRRFRPHVVAADEGVVLASQLMDEGTVTVIGAMRAHADLRRAEHRGTLDHLPCGEIQVPAQIVRAHPALLQEGVWGTCRLSYTATLHPPVVLEDFTPCALSHPDVDRFRRARALFSTEEWIDLLVMSTGIDPGFLGTTRRKLVWLSRIAPLAQGSLHFVEVGPRQTGKTYLLRNLSQQVHLASGGSLTAPQLFYDAAKRTPGLVALRKVIVLDEVGDMRLRDSSLGPLLKDFLESGKAARGGREMASDACLVFSGNVDLHTDGVTPSRRLPYLLSVFPDGLRDTALIDRLAGILPGWELPKITPGALWDGVGLLSDYVGATLIAMRDDAEPLAFLRAQYGVEGGTLRDQTGVHRIASALLKIVFPDARYDERWLHEILRLSLEFRQRVRRDLFRIAPAEFPEVTLCMGALQPSDALDLADGEGVDELDIEVCQRDRVGLISTLYVTENGLGGVGFVEAHQRDTGRGYEISGLHGPSYRHAVRAAFNALVANAAELGLEIDRLNSGRLAVHLVRVAVKKDGPSAGLALALCMLSAVTGRAIRSGLAVTGELSTLGHVGEIGGLGAKLRAAARRGRTLVIIPSANAAELVHLGDLASTLDIRPVRSLADAARIALLGDEEEGLRAS
jgi:ATP-dependent Lon protease